LVESLWILLQWILLVIVTSQIDVFLKLIISWRVLTVSMIVGEPKLEPSLGEGVVPISYRTQSQVGIALGDFETMFFRVSWIFLVWELQVVVTRVDVLLTLMFTQI